MLELDNPFWRFSVTVYAQTGVAEECLTLQDALSIDVNVLLFSAWAGTNRLLLADTHFMAIEDRVGSWHDRIVRTLRAVRRRIKAMPEVALAEVKAFRQDVASLELRAEQIEQAILFAAARDLFQAASISPAPEAVRANVAAYLQSKTVDAACTPPDHLIAAALSYQPASGP